jgi:hypothetical protein
VQWYLEQKEEELQGEEDYNTELALARKVLKKMVKVSLLFFLPLLLLLRRCDVEMLTVMARTISSWRFAGRVWRMGTMLARGGRPRRHRLFMCCTLTVR